MPRESKMKLPPHNIAVKNAMLTVETRYEYDPKQGERVPIPRREKAVDALACLRSAIWRKWQQKWKLLWKVCQEREAADEVYHLRCYVTQD